MEGKITFYLDPTVQQFGVLNFILEVEGQAWFWGELQTQSTPGKSILECSGLEGRTHITLTVEGVFFTFYFLSISSTARKYLQIVWSFGLWVLTLLLAFCHNRNRLVPDCNQMVTLDISSGCIFKLANTFCIESPYNCCPFKKTKHL